MVLNKILFALVACEESQTTVKELRKRGFIAFSCDIQNCSGGKPEFHITGDCLPLLNGKCWIRCDDGTLHYIDHWDLLIGHPPCTYLSKVTAPLILDKNHNIKNLDRYNLLLDARSFFFTLWDAPIKYIMLENPIPLSIAQLPPYTQLVQPYNFGSIYSKATCLWLKNLPLIFNTCISYEHISYTATCHGSKMRSKSFPGISAALADTYTYFFNSLLDI